MGKGDYLSDAEFDALVRVAKAARAYLLNPAWRTIPDDENIELEQAVEEAERLSLI